MTMMSATPHLIKICRCDRGVSPIYNNNLNYMFIGLNICELYTRVATVMFQLSEAKAEEAAGQ